MRLRPGAIAAASLCAAVLASAPARADGGAEDPLGTASPPTASSPQASPPTAPPSQASSPQAPQSQAPPSQASPSQASPPSAAAPSAPASGASVSSEAAPAGEPASTAPAGEPASTAPAGEPASTAPDKAACVGALDDAQASRAGRKLLESRASYVTCSHEACPDMIRADCSKGLREVDEALPTLVLSASVDGKDATDAKALLDGEHLAGGLDGRAIPVDPGPHVARFERPGSGAVEVKLVAREGEKNRLVTGTFGVPRAEAAQVRGEGSRFPVVPVAFAVTGALALGGAFLMHVNMTDRANELGNTCAPWCPQSDRDALSDRLVLRNVSLGVGIGALVVAAVTYVVGSRR